MGRLVNVVLNMAEVMEKRHIPMTMEEPGDERMAQIRVQRHAETVPGIGNRSFTDVPIPYGPSCPQAPDRKACSGSILRTVGPHPVAQQDAFHTPASESPIQIAQVL